jgi:hypothetical protein
MFLAAMATGSALIAFWIAIRFPERGPESFGVALIHVGMSFAVGWGAATAFGTIVGFGKAAALASIFAVLLPALTYTFLAAAWFLKLAHGMISHYRH